MWTKDNRQENMENDQIVCHKHRIDILYKYLRIYISTQQHVSMTGDARSRERLSDGYTGQGTIGTIAPWSPPGTGPNIASAAPVLCTR